MQAKFASLSVVLSAVFVSQVLGAVPRTVDCSLVRCASVECPLGETARIEAGACCPTCVPCGIVACPLIACIGGSVTLPGNCCPTCVPGSLPVEAVAPDCSAVQCLACPKNTIAMSYVLSVSVKSNLAIAALLADREWSDIEKAKK
ncbi:hypothetical protein B0H19DRAFT_1250559 [Mycena capillaripes]|nr:hypothetical protein B0H19DRAFT_1250559 [Mycena capillaripes]